MTMSQYKSTDVGLSKVCLIQDKCVVKHHLNTTKLAHSLWRCHPFPSLHHRHQWRTAMDNIYTGWRQSFLQARLDAPVVKTGAVNRMDTLVWKNLPALLLQPSDRGGPATRLPNKNELKKKRADIALHLPLHALHAVSYLDYCYPQELLALLTGSNCP